MGVWADRWVLAVLRGAQIGMNDTAATATLKALRKRSSNNINYQVLEELLGESARAADRPSGLPAPGTPVNLVNFCPKIVAKAVFFV